MLFHSPEFILVYLPITFIAFFLLSRISRFWAALWLALASLFFYGWWSAAYVALLLGSIVVNFGLGYAIGHARAGGRPQRALSLLVCGVVANLGLLAYYKYANFFISTFISLSGHSLSLTNIILPLGVSFFTFTQLAFLIDVYRGIAVEYNFVHYALFVSYFPHLIAGPVLHHKQMMPQFADANIYRMDAGKIGAGLSIFLIGLAKKAVLADSLAVFVEPVFGAARGETAITLFDGWLGALCYSFQIYFDFSGYSDMAIGLSLLFGVTLPINFNSPYKAANIIEFWRRWHMTLSQFLRDYLYIPLGGNRMGESRRQINIMVTMLLGGLWHGASWTFVFWGGLHGLYLIVNHLWRMVRPGHEASGGGATGFGRLLGTALTFTAVTIGWVFFRSSSAAVAFNILSGMAGINGVTIPSQFTAIIPSLATFMRTQGTMATLGGGTIMGAAEQVGLVLISAVICFGAPNCQEMTGHQRLLAVAACAGFIVQAVFFARTPSEFIYFQF
jgi:alginate O-acetyltransferase complex protein AlgI